MRVPVSVGMFVDVVSGADHRRVLVSVYVGLPLCEVMLVRRVCVGHILRVLEADLAVLTVGLVRVALKGCRRRKQTFE